MQPQLTPSPYPRQRPAPCAPDFLSEDLIADAVASRPSDREPRHDGWTPDRIRMFLQVLSQCGVVEDAARACGMSKQGAYNFRNSARGRAFDVAWRSAQLLARNRIADDVMSRAIYGCREVIIRDGEVWGERHRFDNRLTMAVLKRLDDLATPHVGQIDQAPRRVAHEFEALVDAVCAGGEEGMAFIQSRCALRYEDFEEQRILERNRDYAASCDAMDDEADGWEPETSSTSGGDEVEQGLTLSTPTPLGLSMSKPSTSIEAAEEKEWPSTGSGRTGDYCPSAVAGAYETAPPTNDELHPSNSSTSTAAPSTKVEGFDSLSPNGLTPTTTRHPETSSTSFPARRPVQRRKHRSSPTTSTANPKAF